MLDEVLLTSSLLKISAFTVFVLDRQLTGLLSAFSYSSVTNIVRLGQFGCGRQVKVHADRSGKHRLVDDHTKPTIPSFIVTASETSEAVCDPRRPRMHLTSCVHRHS